MSDVILFDLDGTLTDPREGITKCVQYALRHFGMEEPDLGKLESFIGPPLKGEFMRRYGFDFAQGDIAVAKYRERFTHTGIYENRLIDGIIPMLDRLVGSGKTLAVASSKPTVFVEQILQHFQIRNYFAVVVGSELDGTRSNKADVIGEVLGRLGLSNYGGNNKRPDIVMVGDREHDVYGAKAHSIPCIGVLFGFGSRVELESAGAACIVESVEQLTWELLNSNLAVKRKENIFLKIWRCTYPAGLYLGVSFVVGFIAEIIIMVSIMAEGALYSSGFNVEELTQLIIGEYMKYVVIMTAISGVIVIPVFLLLYKKDRKREKDQHIIKKMRWPEALIVAGIAIVTCLGLNNLISISRIAEIFPGFNEVAEYLYAGGIFLEIIGIGIIAPIAEELMFRGLIYKRIKAYSNVKTGALLTSLFFGVYHGNVVQGIYAFILSLILIYVLEKCHSMAAPILVHVAANITSVIASETSILDFLYSNEMIFLIGTVIEVAVAIILLYYLNKRTAVNDETKYVDSTNLHI